MKILPIKQRDDSACGPASIQMVLVYFELPHSFEKIAKISQYKKKDGLWNRDLVKTLQTLDLTVREKTNATWTDLARFNTTDKVIIVSWMKFGYIGHFSVVEKVSKHYITLADPHDGKSTKMERMAFMRLWMDYDDMWYPSKNTDIQLRWMCIVSKKEKTRGG
ncbi:MAG: C39 family peptidase [Parcubacteria group bacterium]|nr:C39 family peptidase [Parcubacteria group bacterium]